MTLDEAITLASIIQKESGNEEEITACRRYLKTA
jgi:cell division protein YceG involved in septum cleavage